MSISYQFYVVDGTVYIDMCKKCTCGLDGIYVVCGKLPVIQNLFFVFRFFLSLQFLNGTFDDLFKLVGGHTKRFLDVF